MKNSYEACDVVELGKAKEVILGYKPCGFLDALFGMNFYYWPVVDDIDEGDE